MSLFAILHSGSSALMAQGRALQTTANNVANAETPGYARQRTELSTTRTLRRSGLLLGQGVSASVVSAAYDRFAQGRVESSLGDNGYATSRSTALRGIETALAEGVDGGIGQRLDELFDAFSALEADPQSPATRLNVLNRGQLFTAALNRGAQSLNDQAAEANRTISESMGSLNDLGSRIASLNQRIVALEAGGGVANDLRVQRLQAIEDLSTYARVTTSDQPDGSVNVHFAGHTLVEGGDARTLSAVEDPVTGDMSVEISHGTTTLNITGNLGSVGSLGAAIETRDVTVPGLLADLDALAFTVANQVNAVHAAGFDLTGGTGNDFFTAPAVQAGSALTLSLDAAVLGNPDGIAAAGSAITVPGGNTNAAQLAALTDALTMAGGTRTFLGFYSESIADLGTTAATAYNEETRVDTELAVALDARDATTAVSLEEEALDLIRFQEAYQAAARVVSATNDLFNDLISIVP